MPKRRKFSIYERETVAQRADECCEYCISQADYGIKHQFTISGKTVNQLENLLKSLTLCVKI